MFRRARLSGVVLIIILALALAGCTEEKSVQKSETVMDTVVTLSASGSDAEKAIDESMERLKALENLASNKIPSSDVSRINNAAGSGEWIKVSPEIFHLLEVSQKYSRLSNGAWDITAGALVDLWGIGTDRARVPSSEEIKNALKLVGYDRLELDENTSSARLLTKGMKIDLGGIAKGMAVDEVRKIYEQHGIENGLINIGASSMYAIGKNTKGADWRVGIRHPRGSADDVLAVVTLSSEALSTSGDYERYIEKDGVRYHHIIDPRTGYPARNGAISDTVVIDGDLADAGMISDLLTTTVFIMGAAGGSDFLATLPPEVSGMIATEDKKLYPAHGFNARLEALNQDFSLCGAGK